MQVFRGIKSELEALFFLSPNIKEESLDILDIEDKRNYNSTA